MVLLKSGRVIFMPTAALYRGLGYISVTLLITAVYSIIGKLSLLLATLHPSASPVWPPTGFALAVLLILGMRYWPAIFMGAFVVNLTTEGTVFTSVAIAVGNALEAYIGAALTQRFASGTKFFERIETVVSFAVIAVFSSALVSSVVGLSALVAANLVPQREIVTVWFTWWIGNTVGALIVAPLIIVWSKGFKRWSMQETLEAVCLYAVLISVSFIVFATPLFPHTYVALFPILWIVIRLKPQAVITGVSLMAAIAVYGTLQNEGPFWDYAPNTSLLYLQSYMILVSLGAMSFAASQYERKKFAESLEYSIAERTAELSQALERERAKFQQLRNVIARFDVATIAADEHMQILHANNHFHKLFSTSGANFSSQTILKIFHDAKDVFHNPEETLEELRTILGERLQKENHRITMRNGAVVLCDYNPIIDDGTHRGHLMLFKIDDVN